MRVFSGSLATETNTFAPMPTGLKSFQDRTYFPAGTHPDRLTMFSGPLWAARLRGRREGWELFEGLVAASQPSGITTREAYESLRDELLSDLRRALPVDLVLLGLHGAMVADGYNDCEGDLLERVRTIVGPHVVIGAELDPHNHLTQKMLHSADLMIAYKEYPHTDVLDRAIELVDRCTALVERRSKPVVAVVDCEMVVIIHTSREPARGFVDRLKEREGKDGIISISVSHGFPWGDVVDMGTKVLVYAESDQAYADSVARSVADELIAMRDDLTVNYPTIFEALEQAAALQGPVVLSDGADNPGGGAAGDSTFLLQSIRERGIRGVALGPLWDPVAVRIAFEAGVGAILNLRVGGKVGPMSGDPVDLRCEVKAIHADMEMTGLANSFVALGDAALIEADGIEIVLVTIRAQAVDTDMFTRLGCSLVDKKLIVVKSSQHFYASFSKVTPHVIYVGAPGTVTVDLSQLPYKNARRQMWPLDSWARSDEDN